MLKKVLSLSFSTIKNTLITRAFISWCILVLGLFVYVTVQIYLIYTPLNQRNQLPEVDDSLAYLARVQVMKECPSHECNALMYLKKQFDEMPSDPDIQRQSEIAGFAFPRYHPMFSAGIIALNTIKHDLISTYKVFWTLSPFLLGIAFACFLTTLWGRTVAGITLFLLAFKVFPDTGTQYLTPSNIALVVGLLVWARILSKDGSAPITLSVGSLILSAIHPIGVLFTLISVAITLLLTKKRKQLYIALVSFSVFCAIVFLFTSLADQFQHYLTVIPLKISLNIKGIAITIANNLLEIGVQLTRYKEALFGQLIILFPAVALGFFYCEKKRQKKLVAVLSVFLIFLLSSLLHSHSLTPNASLFFRVFVPFYIVLYGAVAHLFYVMVINVFCLPAQDSPSIPIDTAPCKPPFLRSVLVLSLLLGYIVETIIPGVEQIQMVQEYMLKRQPLSLNKNQPQLLLSKAKPEDIVLYTSTMIMASYFIHNCMKFGAVYYHPVFSRSERMSTLLQQKNLKFAAVFNPGVFHPTYAGLDEKDSCITLPELTYSPLSKARKFGPINQEGVIPAKNYQWIEVHPKTDEGVEKLKIYINNPGKQTEIKLIEQAVGETMADQSNNSQSISANWFGWVTFPLAHKKQGDTYRLVLPQGNTKVSVGGISFDDTYFWPWSHRALLILQGKNEETGAVQLSFDPSDLLPSELKMKPVTVIHDQGSSVLLEFGQ
jgi:hypothetical protein